MSLRIDQAALDGIVRRSGVVRRVAREMRDEARDAASGIAGRSETHAIAVEDGVDAEGPYSDLGYRKDHPGFFLWWWEVGTKNHPPTPHLRPTMRPRL